MASRTFNVGLVGYSVSAKVFHIPLIQSVPQLKIHAIVQRNPTPDNDAGKDLGIKVYKSVDELVEDDQVDVVIINTPPSSHYELARIALEHGKNVVVEKPFTPTSKEAQELVDLAEQQNKLLTVYQNRRWDSDFLTVAKLIRENALGRITEFETHFDRHRPEASNSGWKSSPGPGSGVVYDLGTHLMDQVIHLFGFPEAVTGFIGTQRENNTQGFEDSATILLHYDGLLATVKAAVVSPETEQLRYWIRGTKGSFKKFHLDIQEEQLKAGRKTGSEGFGIEPEDRHGVLSSVGTDGTITSQKYPTVKPETWSRYYSTLAAALEGGPAPVSMEDAVGLTKLVELARQSSTERKTLPFPK